MPTDVTAALVEVVVAPADATTVEAVLVEVVVAPDVDSTQVHGVLVEVVVAPNVPTGPGGAGGACPVAPGGVRLWWAVDVSFGGVERRYATRECVVDGAVYRSGLGPITGQRIDSLQAIGLQVTSPDQWAHVFAASAWLVDGGTCRLWVVVSEGGVTRRHLWAVGRVEGTRWGRQGEPVQWSLVPTAGQPTLPHARERIDSWTRPAQVADDPQLDEALVLWAESGPYFSYDDGFGLYYPIVIGYPGHRVDKDEPDCVVPCPVAQVTRETVILYNGSSDPTHPETWQSIHVYILASGAIDATTVYVLDTGVTQTYTTDPTADEPVTVEVPQTVPVQVTPYVGPDRIGQRCTWWRKRLWPGISQGSPALYAGYQLATGGGVKHRGRVVRGAADIFEWIADVYAGVQLDQGRHRSNAAQLNAYKIDTWVNETVDAREWFEGEVLPFIPAAIVRTDAGSYLAHLPLSATDVVPTRELVVGRNAQRAGMSIGAVAEVVNELTFCWSQQRDGKAYAYTRILTTRNNRPQPVPGGGYYLDYRALPHALAVASQAAHGVRHGTLELPSVWDPPTAYRMAEDYLTRRAFPSRLFELELELEHWDLLPGEVVWYTDAELSIPRVRCTVVDVQVSTTEIRAVLRPIRTPTLYL